MKNYRYAHELNKKDSATDVRHIPIVGGGAPVIALLGGDKDLQVEANWDVWKLRGGALAGTLLGGLAGSYAGYALKGSPLAATAAAALGSLGGFGLGHYLTFKTMAKNRGVDDTYSLRHLPIIGKGAQVAALQGYSPEDQVESNWNVWKIRIPNYLVTSGVSAMGAPVPGVLLGLGVGLYAYDKLKNNKLNEL